jgi:hypothetical protein
VGAVEGGRQPVGPLVQGVLDPVEFGVEVRVGGLLPGLWMRSRTVSSLACTSLATAGTVFPPAEASSIIARRYRTTLVLPRRTIRCNFCSSCSVGLRTLTGCAIPPPAPIGRVITSNRRSERTDARPVNTDLVTDSGHSRAPTSAGDDAPVMC